MHSRLNTNSHLDDQTFICAEVRKIAKRLCEAKRRCGSKAKGSDRWNYRDIKYELPESTIAAASLLFEKLGPIPAGHSLDRIDPRGPYSLDNIRYASAFEQTANRVLTRLAGVE